MSEFKGFLIYDPTRILYYCVGMRLIKEPLYNGNIRFFLFNTFERATDELDYIKANLARGGHFIDDMANGLPDINADHLQIRPFTLKLCIKQ